MTDRTTYMDEYFTWRRAQQKKHRVMTMAEYQAWCFSGDAISHPSNSNAMRGGLSITLNDKTGVLGRIVDYEPPPAYPREATAKRK